MIKNKRSVRLPCPCCNNLTFETDEPLEHEICPVCFWENDPIQNENPDYVGGPNHVTLNEARENYKKFGACRKDMLQYVKKYEDLYPHESFTRKTTKYD